jgi:hypothetical protein
MGRHTNKLTKILLEDESAKQEFVELMKKYNCSLDVYEHIKKNGFRGIRFYAGYQSMCHVIRRLGFKGARRGRKPTRPNVIENTGLRWSNIEN